MPGESPTEMALAPSSLSSRITARTTAEWVVMASSSLESERMFGLTSTRLLATAGIPAALQMVLTAWSTSLWS